MPVETGVDIFEVLTATALLIVVVLMGVVLAYVVKIVRILSRVMASAENGLDSLKTEMNQVFESEKRDRTGTMAAVMVLFGFLWRMFHKNKSAKVSKGEAGKKEKDTDE